MTISIYDMSVGAFAPMLQTLANLVDKGANQVGVETFNATLIKARLAPDMFNLATQVQLVCHHAKDPTIRLTGGAPQPIEPIEERLDAVKARIAETSELLARVDAAAFEGAEERDCSVVVPGGERIIVMNGLQFLRDWAIPQFYFHAVTAYDILRHNGVTIGKKDYIQVRHYIRPRTAAS